MPHCLLSLDSNVPCCVGPCPVPHCPCVGILGGHTGVCIDFGTAMISKLLDSLPVCWNLNVSSILHAHLQNTVFCAYWFLHILVE